MSEKGEDGGSRWNSPFSHPQATQIGNTPQGLIFLLKLVFLCPVFWCPSPISSLGCLFSLNWFFLWVWNSVILVMIPFRFHQLRIIPWMSQVLWVCVSRRVLPCWIWFRWGSPNKRSLRRKITRLLPPLLPLLRQILNSKPPIFLEPFWKLGLGRYAWNFAE